MILSDVISPIVPIAPVVAQTEVNDEQMALYADLIYRRTGIRVVPQKKTLLSNRVRRRLRETGIRGFDAYYEHLTRLRARRSGMGPVPARDHHARDLPVPRCEPLGVVPRDLPAAVCGGGAIGKPAVRLANLVGGLQHGRRSVHRRLLHRRLPAQLSAVADSHRRHGHRHRRGDPSQGRPVLGGAIRLVPQSYKERFFSKDMPAGRIRGRPGRC